MRSERSDATTKQLGDHLKEDPELPNIVPPEVPALVRAHATEWNPEELPVTPTKDRLLPPVSWTKAPESDQRSVSLDIRSEEDGSDTDSASPEPLQRGVGAMAFLRANGAHVDEHVESKGADKDAAACEVEGRGGEGHDPMEIQEAGDEHEDNQQTQHYSPEEKPEGMEPVERDSDDEIPLLTHAAQHSLRKGAGRKKKGEGQASAVEPKAKPTAKATACAKTKAAAKSTAKAKAKKAASKSSEAPQEHNDADDAKVNSAPKKKGWPKGKAKAKAALKRPAAANGSIKRKHEPDQEPEQDHEKEVEHEEQESEKPEEGKKPGEAKEPKPEKKGTCLVTPEQKKHLKSSLGNIRWSMQQVCMCLCA